MVTKSNYLLKCHKFYSDRIESLKEEIKELKDSLTEEEFSQHPDVKFAVRVRKATKEIIPEDPGKKEYQLHGGGRSDQVKRE